MVSLVSTPLTSGVSVSQWADATRIARGRPIWAPSPIRKVRAAIDGVLREATMAALLTALMILLFLGSWRSTIIVCISIPLSILTSLAILNLLHETIAGHRIVKAFGMEQFELRKFRQASRRLALLAGNFQREDKSAVNFISP